MLNFVDLLSSKLNFKKIKYKKIKTKKESIILRLNPNNAKQILKWECKYNINECIKKTASWYSAYLRKEDMILYSKKEINDLFLNITKDIFSLYFKEEGGFSYFQDKSQSHYYGIKITDSLKTPDLHGTLLCLWAINMILDNIERLEDDKQIIKP